MAKILIPSILVATILIAGAFALLPVQEAVTLHLTGSAAAADTDTVDSAAIVDGTIVTGDISNTANIAGSQLAANAAIVSGQIFDGTIVTGDISNTANIAGSQLAANAAIVSGQIFDGTIANVDLAAQVIPISTDILADAATTTAGSIVDLGDILLTYTGTHTIIITASAEVTLNAATVAYAFSIPALGVGTDCGSGDDAIHTQPVWTGTAASLGTSSFSATFVCTGVPSATAIQVGHTSTTNTVTVNELALVGIAYPT